MRLLAVLASLISAVTLPIAVCALEPFPLAETVAEVRKNLEGSPIISTKLTRDDYLQTLGGIVQFFRHFQSANGRIIDPFAHREVQYSTPCYAWAAAALVASGRETNLLDSSASALDAALDELAEGNAADGHGDFSDGLV